MGAGAQEARWADRSEALPNQPQPNATQKVSNDPQFKGSASIHMMAKVGGKFKSLTKDSQRRRVDLWKAIEEKMSSEHLDWDRQRIPRRREPKIQQMLQHLQLDDDQLQIADEFVAKSKRDTDLVNIVVRSAAKTGNITALKWLEAAALWDPRCYQHAKTAMDAADSGGQLLTFLGSFYVRVTRTTAEAYYEKLKTELTIGAVSKNINGGHSYGSEGFDFKAVPQHYYANLVANFIKVRSNIADQIMEDIVTQKELLLAANRQSVYVMATSMNFPNHLGTIYITRKAAFSKETLSYDHRNNMVKYQEDGECLRTSGTSPITLPTDARICALIPADAEHFAFVYGAKWLPVGGYLYLDGEYNAVSLNPISFITGTHAFRFGNAIKCFTIEERSQSKLFAEVELKEESVPSNGDCTTASALDRKETPKRTTFDDEWEPVTVQSLNDLGASHYMWIPPGDRRFAEEVDPEKSTTALGGSSSNMASGGFAYKMVDSDGNFNHIRFFPLQGSGELVDRGIVGWEVNACEIPQPEIEEEDEQPNLGSSDSNEEDIQHNKLEERDMGILVSIIDGSLSTYFFGWRTSKAALADSMDHALTAGAPVKFARLVIPGALHANLLHAMSVATRQSVLSSLSAKAVTTAAFRRTLPTFMLDFVLETCTFVVLWQLVMEKRHHIEGFNATPSPTPSPTPPAPTLDGAESALWSRSSVTCKLCLLWLLIYGLRTTVLEIVLLREHLARGWMDTYWDMTRTLSIFNVTLVAGTLCLFAVSGDWWVGSDHTWEITLALTFACRLLKALNFLRAMETGKIGLRIAPILSSLVESMTFLFIVACMLGFFISLFWGLGPTSREFVDVTDSMYRLGLLADFEMDSDIQTSPDPYDRVFEYSAFVLASILVSVALMNIFIGMFTSYYDHYQDRVVELFVRHRAAVCATYMIQSDGLRRIFGCCRRMEIDDAAERRVWLCYKDYNGDAEEAAEISLRTTLKTVIEEEVISLNERLGKLEKLTENIQKTISKFAKVPIARASSSGVD